MTYISVDVETDGPIPGPYSLLSLGAVAFDTTGEEIGAFSVNLAPLPEAVSKDTMGWWKSHSAAWQAATANQQAPQHAMELFSQWVEGYPPAHVCVAYPASFDFTFVYWYLIRFVGRSPFGFSALDLKSYAAAILGTPFRTTTRKSMPQEWLPEHPKQTHLALDEAREQGQIFFRMQQYAARPRPAMMRGH